MTKSIGENVSKRINSLRFLLMVFVVIIHNDINEKSFTERGITAAVPDYVESVQRFVGIITAVAVPLFFLISSYLLYTKEQAFVPVLKKKCKTIAAPYLLWHIVLIGIYFAVSVIPFTKQYFTPEKPIPSWGFFDWIKAFAGDYSKMAETDDVKSYPFIYQFWFIRDLFILNIFFSGIKKLADKFPLGTFVLCLILWINNIRIYIVAPEALIFFTIGYYAVKYKLGIKNIDLIKITDLTAVYGITVILEYLFQESMPVLQKINIIIGCIYFLKISEYIIENIRLYKILAWLEKYAFAVYAVHGIVIPQLLKIYIGIIPLNGVYILFGYFVMIILGVFVSLAFGIILKKLFPKIYGVLTGGRV
jgi:hypothetical protein